MQTYQVEAPLGYQRVLAFTPDSRFLAVGARTFTFLDTTGGPERRFPHLGFVGWCGATALVGDAVVSTSGRTSLKVFRTTTGEQHRLVVRCWSTTSVVAGSNPAAVFVSVNNNQRGVRGALWSLHLTDTKRRASFAETKDVTERLVISADGRWLAGKLSGVATIRVWHVGGPKLPSRSSFNADVPFYINDFALSADGSHVATVDNYALEVWNTKTGKHKRSGKHRSIVSAVACHPTRPVLVTGDHAGKVFLWSHDCRVLTRYNWELGVVRGLAFAPDGLRCAVVYVSGKVVVWDVDV
jgi:WD40 repeat protein